MAASKTGPRSKKVYSTVQDALGIINAELKPKPFQTTRSFWVDGVKYIARKTNRTANAIRLSVQKV